MFIFMWKWYNKRKSACEMLRQITFLRVSLVPKRCSGIFNVSNAWTNMWNKMMEEKAGVERQNSKKEFETMSMTAAWREFKFYWLRIEQPVRS